MLMKVTLISPYPDITCFGLRTMSAYLKDNGHQTQLIFLPDPQGDDLVMGKRHYDERVLAETAGLCADSDLVGLTLMTNHFEAAVEISAYLKSKSDTPVVWGGVHPTVRPEECLQHADLVCVGEGEDVILDLANRMERGEDLSDLANVWLRKDGRVIQNAVRPLEMNLDVYPVPDYSGEDHHVMYKGSVKPLDYDLTRTLLARGTVADHLHHVGYQTMTGRGCPHQCTYCINDAIKCMYGKRGYLRWRSNDHVMSELTWVKEHMPYVGYVWISDDAFIARSQDSIEEFCDRYKDKINLPFSCLVSPLTVTEKKMERLVDAGLIYIQMGVESGSPHMQEVYNRPHMNNEKTLKAMHVINKHKDRMQPPGYDFLLDAPYETDDDRVESLRLIAQIPKPFRLQPFALVLYPGTELHDRAKADGLIDDERRDVYNKSWTMKKLSYLNLLFVLSRGGRLPPAVLRFLISRPALAVMNNRITKYLSGYAYLILWTAYRFCKRAMGKK